MAASSGASTTGATGAATQPSAASGYSAVGTSVLSGALGAWSSYESGRTNRTISRYQASIADLQSRRALEEGTFQANRIRLQTQKLIGTQRAGFAGQGVIVGKDTAGAVEAYTQAVGDADALAVKNNAFLEAWGFDVSAASSRAQGNNEMVAARSRAIGSLLTSGSNIGKFLDRADLGQNKSEPSGSPDLVEY